MPGQLLQVFRSAVLNSYRYSIDEEAQDILTILKPLTDKYQATKDPEKRKYVSILEEAGRTYDAGQSLEKLREKVENLIEDSSELRSHIIYLLNPDTLQEIPEPWRQSWQNA